MNERSWGFPREGSDDVTECNCEHLSEVSEQGAIIRRHGCHVGTSATYAVVSAVTT